MTYLRRPRRHHNEAAPTYHEQVARQLSRSVVVGRQNSYETILARIHERFPNEEDLRRYISVLERMAQVIAPGFQYVEEDPPQPNQEADHEQHQP